LEADRRRQQRPDAFRSIRINRRREELAKQAYKLKGEFIDGDEVIAPAHYTEGKDMIFIKILNKV